MMREIANKNEKSWYCLWGVFQSSPRKIKKKLILFMGRVPIIRERLRAPAFVSHYGALQ